MRPALLPQRESGAVLYSSHAHCKNIREQIQTTPALPTQEYTRAGADHPPHSRRRNTREPVQTVPRCAAFLLTPLPRGPLGAGSACRAIACGLNLPGHWVRA